MPKLLPRRPSSRKPWTPFCQRPQNTMLCSLNYIGRARIVRALGMVGIGWVMAGAMGYGAPKTASADIANIDLGASIYTKWLYRNNDSQGVLNLGNPFWPDNIAGDNGVGSEFELRITGRLSQYVEAGARIQSRFGSLWQDWWENGDIGYDEHNTSGESLGMNHAQYMKLRGYYVRFAPPIPTIQWITVGASDLSMFNPWTIGKVRYIDRDNAKGTFIEGAVGDAREFSYNLAVIALPKLWVGPSWSTGIGDPNLLNPFYANDWAYGAKFQVNPDSWGRFELIGTVTNDLEIDTADPDAQGTIYPTCQDDLGNEVPGCQDNKNGAVGTFTRYLNAVLTLEAQLDPADIVSVNLFGGLSMQQLDPQLATNGVANSGGVFPVPFADIGFFDKSYAGRIRVELLDPFEVGLGMKFEYFNIGENWVSMFGARREADVLLTEGFLGGGQLPTLNLANEFVDFDEQWYESIVGWHGGTALFDYEYNTFGISAEYTFITYNTNAQNRDVDFTYPTFLHSEGFTDIDVYDYANTLDRGRDPRSVYRRHQDRASHIAVVNADYVIDLGRGIELGAKFKLIADTDKRSEDSGSGDGLVTGTRDDDYSGLLFHGKFSVAYPFTDELRVGVSAEVDRWSEKNRDGILLTDGQGNVTGANYGDTDTDKEKVSATLRYDFEGVHLNYLFEYIHKVQDRELKPDQNFHIVQGKATVEVSW